MSIPRGFFSSHKSVKTRCSPAPSQDDVHVAESADHPVQVITGSHLTAVIAKDKNHTEFGVIQKTCREVRDKGSLKTASTVAPADWHSQRVLQC